VTFRLTAAANLTVEIADESGAVVATVLDRVWTRAGEHSVPVDGSALPDGRYTIVLRAHTAVVSDVVTSVPLLVSRTLGLVEVSPAAFSPNGDGRSDLLDLGFMLAAPADVKIRILRDGRWVATPLEGSFGIGPQRLRWDGSKRIGRVRDGEYAAVVEATDAFGTVAYSVPFVSDTVAPRVRILPGRRLRVEVSEPAVLKLYVNGQPLRREVQRAGVVLIRWPEPVVRARAVALDTAGNASAPAIRRAGS
jgi:hypothetical protein